MVAINESLTRVTPSRLEIEPQGAAHAYQFRGLEVARQHGTIQLRPRSESPRSAASKEANAIDQGPASSISTLPDTSTVVLNYDAYLSLATSQAQLDFVSNTSFAHAREVSDLMAVRLLRKHFLEEIIRHLDRIDGYAKQPEVASYANQLFRVMRQVRDRLPRDPFTAVVLALHDALAFQDNWLRYSAEQFRNARAILVRFGNQDLREDKALKAVAALEDAGFDTTPFSLPDDKFTANC